MSARRRAAAVSAGVAVAALLAACSSSAALPAVPTGGSGPGGSTSGAAATTSAGPVTSPASGAMTPRVRPPTTPAPPPPAPSAVNGATPSPPWLGRRVLALRKDGYGVMGATPKELDPRDIATVDVLPPPADGRFHSSVSAVPADVAARSTWDAGCPVALADLRYVTVSFVGFDGLAHTGELVVNASAADAMVRVFHKLFDARFPIERMVVTTAFERDMPPTGDGNTTAAFNCRSAAGTTHWSQHAYGLAVDVNPFMNPYLKGDVVLPELARTYARRGDVRPGMVTAGGVVARAFAAEGWGWGGNWKSLKDYMHFSANGT